MDPLFSTIYKLNSITSSAMMALHWITYQGWYAIKQGCLFNEMRFACFLLLLFLFCFCFIFVRVLVFLRDIWHLLQRISRIRRQRARSTKIWIWQQTIWWWGSSNTRILVNDEYPYIAIAPRCTQPTGSYVCTHAHVCVCVCYVKKETQRH